MHEADQVSGDAGISPGFVSEQGLASLVAGAALFVAAPVGLVFNAALWDTGPGGIDLELALFGSVIGIVIVNALSLGSLYTGVRGLRAASRSRQPRSLCLWGSLMSAGALLLWLIVSIDLLMIVEFFMR